MKYIALSVASLLVFVVFTGIAYGADFSSGEGEQSADMTTASVTKLLTYYTNLSGSDTIGGGPVSLSTSLSLSFIWGVPINITAMYPKSIQPGQNFNVNMYYGGEQGFVNLSADLSASVNFGIHQDSFDYSFDKTIAYYNVTVGENKTGDIESVRIPVYYRSFAVESLSLDVRFLFNYVASSYLTGNASLVGNALASNVNQEISGEETTLNAKAIDNPWGYESANLQVNDLKYHIKHFSLYLTGIEFIVSLSGSLYNEEFPIFFDLGSLQIMSRSTSNNDTRAYSAYGAYGTDLGGDSNTVKSFGTLSVASLSFPFTILLMKVILPIIVAVVVVVVVLAVRRKKKAALAKQQLMAEVANAPQGGAYPAPPGSAPYNVNQAQASSITVSCPYCGFTSTMPPTARGKWVRCPQCGNVFEVKANSETQEFNNT